MMHAKAGLEVIDRGCTRGLPVGLHSADAVLNLLAREPEAPPPPDGAPCVARSVS